MSHTIYTANGKVCQRMCYCDYTEWITRSFVNKAKEGGLVRISNISWYIGDAVPMVLISHGVDDFRVFILLLERIYLMVLASHTNCFPSIRTN